MLFTLTCFPLRTATQHPRFDFHLLKAHPHIHQSLIQQIFIAVLPDARRYSRWGSSWPLELGKPRLPFAAKSVTSKPRAFDLSSGVIVLISCGDCYEKLFRLLYVWLRPEQKRPSINMGAGKISTPPFSRTGPISSHPFIILSPTYPPLS